MLLVPIGETVLKQYGGAALAIARLLQALVQETVSTKCPYVSRKVGQSSNGLQADCSQPLRYPPPSAQSRGLSSPLVPHSLDASFGGPRLQLFFKLNLWTLLPGYTRARAPQNNQGGISDSYAEFTIYIVFYRIREKCSWSVHPSRSFAPLVLLDLEMG